MKLSRIKQFFSCCVCRFVRLFKHEELLWYPCDKEELSTQAILNTTKLKTSK